MQSKKWKNIAATTIVAAATVASQTAHASWATYTAYQVNGQDGLPSAAYALNSYNNVAGTANFTSNAQDFTAMLGGPSTGSTFYNMPNSWDSFQLNSLNNAGVAVGSVTMGFHPTAVYLKPGSPAINMVTGLTYTYYSYSSGINHAGLACGSYHREDPQGLRFHMFRWDPTTQTRTGDWPNLESGGINENGMMVAQNLVPTNYYQLPELALVPATGNPTMVVAPGFYTYMQPNGISTGGGITVVGDMHSYIENDSNSYASGFVYNQAANVWNVLPGAGNQYFETHGLGVAYWGDRVAGYTVDASANQTATVWENDNGTWNATAVSALVNDPLWRFNQATAISPEGAISGFGMHKEGHRWFQRAFVLVPNNQFSIGAFESGIRGGVVVNPIIHLNGMDPFALDFGLSSNSRLVTVPAGVRMPGMQSSVPFAMTTPGVDSNTAVEVTASFGSLTTARQYLLLPAVLNGFTLKANSDGVENGLLTWDGAAGPSGMTVTLSSSNPKVAVPATLKIAPQGASATFRITVARTVPHGTPVTITASCRGVTLTQSFTTL